MRNKLTKNLNQLLLAIGTIILALLVGAVIISFSGNSPIEAYLSMFNGAFGSKQRFMEVLVKMIPLVIMALGTSVAFKANLWNIGADGQFIMGSIFAIFVTIYSGLPPIIGIPVSIIAAMIGGGLWAGLAGWIKVKFNANEVITTLMLNYIAVYFLSFLVYGPMMDPGGSKMPQTKLIPDAFRLPLFESGNRLHIGIFISLIIVVIMIFFWKSTLGFKIALLGQGEKVTTYSGVSVKKMIVFTMIISGLLSGIAGWTEIYGVQYRLLEGITSGYGSMAIVIALMGGLNPVGILISGFFFSALLVGGATMQRMTDIPFSIVDIVQGLIIIFIIARTAINFKEIKNRIVRRMEHVK
ncbi:MAG: ABC-type uncharacterized transport system permease component [Fusobacteria bacterium]|nr:MAG: ABC-type uncharacterized transport system permease component [Fusobacteriota bacterium]KAF0229052.1 MAG: ABC-type uncharacterized transport system permease [Fusobacteriota bacterium]